MSTIYNIMVLNFFDKNKDKTLAFFELAPIIQVMSVLFLVYITIFKKMKILLPFFILFGLQAFLDRQSYHNHWKIIKPDPYDMIWYHIDGLHLFLSCICIFFILYR
jgi:hypothetical protein